MMDGVNEKKKQEKRNKIPHRKLLLDIHNSVEKQSQHLSITVPTSCLKFIGSVWKVHCRCEKNNSRKLSFAQNWQFVMHKRNKKEEES